MEYKKVKLYCKNNDTYKEFPVGIRLIDTIQEFGITSPYVMTNVKVNNVAKPLNYQAFRPKTIEFMDISRSTGMRTYIRSLCFILSKAVRDIVPGSSMFIEHAVSKGYFFRIESEENVTLEVMNKIKSRMKEIVAMDMPFISKEEETYKVVDVFRRRGMEDKALLLETSKMMYAKYYELDGHVDYFYGYLVPSTGYIQIFDIVKYNGGFLLQIPNRKNPVTLEPVIKQDKLSEVYREHLRFLNIVGLDNVGDLNKAKQENRISEVIQVSEAFQEKSISNIAQMIASQFEDGVRLVLISGPSSSGKTTFRKRLEVQLMVNLLKPIGISLDDYFVNRDDTPLDEDGEKDYESLYALDLDLFERDMNKLLAFEEIEKPSYNFTTGKREYKGEKMRIGKDSILIVEGIHALNPHLSDQIADSAKFKIYVSALTSISLDNHNWIPASDNRLLRRIVRDARFRNYTASHTISRWASVRRGEDKWIFPFQEEADVMFNSAMIYELGAIRRHAEAALNMVTENEPEYAEAHRLLRFLKYFNYITDRELPPTSLLREFVGGSSFRY